MDNRLKNIIAIQGYKNTGKDTVAIFFKYLLSTPKWMHHYWIADMLDFISFSKWKIVKYATNLKIMLAAMTGVPLNYFENRVFKECWYYDFTTGDLIDPFVKTISNRINDKNFIKELKKDTFLDIPKNYTLTIRQLMQFFGTDVMRKTFGEKLWINSTLNTNDQFLIISDQRFLDENETLRQSKHNVKIIHLERSGTKSGYHTSEKELSDMRENEQYDVLLNNNGSLKDLFNQCKKITYEYSKTLR